MDASLAAFRKLCSLARADGAVCQLERGVLDCYRRALGIKKRMLRRPVHPDKRALESHEAIVGSPQECAHVMKMMARVAWADGKLNPREADLLTEVAATLGIGKLQFAGILAAAESDAAHRALVHRRLTVGGSILAAGVLVAVGLVMLTGPTAEDIEAEHLRLTALEDRFDRLPAGSGFKAVEKEYRDSVLMIVTRYDLVSGSSRRSEFSSGTGFFVSPDGVIATNKHVLQPWKFVPRLVKLIASGYQVDPSSVEIMAWTSGAVVQMANRDWNRHTCFYNRTGTLAVLATAPDTMKTRSRKLKTGGFFRGRYHASDNSDLAILKAEVPSPVKALRLHTARAGVEKLDPVMVMGFPTGATILEGRRAENSPSVGIVRKVEDTIFIDAPIVGGNSGGPALDATGRVVGVATRTYGDASLGCCILTSHLVDLLPGAGHFIAAAQQIAATHPDLALHALDLAALRRPSTVETQQIGTLRTTCEASRGRE